MDFSHLNLKVEKGEVAHQAMMKMLIDAGFVTQSNKQWLGKWGKLLRTQAELNGFYPDHLETLIKKGKQLEKEDKANARGFVRNRLEKADWRRYI